MATERPDWEFDHLRGIARVPLTRGLFAVIDICDASMGLCHVWHAHVCKGGTYARTWVRGDGGKRIGLLLHKAITGYKMTDHVDGDGLNNRRGNLRPTDRAGNNRNKRMQHNNQAGLKGVSVTRSGRWRARIAVNGKQMTIGTFDSPDAAHQAYRAASAVYHGDFGRAE